MINPKKQQRLAEEDKELIDGRKELHAAHAEEASAKKSKTKLIVVSVFLVLVFVVGGYAYWVNFAPGTWDFFAKCLTEKGVVMQGEEWCQYTQAQKGMFGKSFKYVNYQINENLEFRPTWIIEGEQYQKVQSFERLSALTGCALGPGL
jgi:hypothetical protein